MSTPMIPVSSSQISYIGYNTEDGNLYVTFSNKHTFRYNKVPLEVYNELKDASSVGKYFNANIKNSYTNTKIN